MVETMFDGKDLHAEVEVSFSEVMQEGGTTKTIKILREDICGSCNGTREKEGSQSMTCYSCGGTGVKEDPLFHKETKCNTCKGHGKLVQNKCSNCKGTGLVMKEETIELSIDRYTGDGDVLEMPLQGHRTLYPARGKNGTLKVVVMVNAELSRWRNGLNVHSNHFISLSDALKGCKVHIDTVHGEQEI